MQRHIGTTTYISLERLEAALDGRDLDNLEEPVPPVDLIQSSEGPGYLNKWRLMSGADDKAWEKLQATGKTKLRRKIILCNPIDAGFGPTNVDAALIASLIEHCDVYLWPDKTVPMSELTPLSSTTQYWENRAGIKITTKEEVQKALVEQGLNINDYQVVDMFERQRLTAKENLFEPYQTDFDYYANSQKNGEYLDLNSTKHYLTEKQQRDTYLNGVNYDQLKLIYLDEIDDLLKLEALIGKKIHVKQVYIKNLKVEEYSLLQGRGIKEVIIAHLIAKKKKEKNWEVPAIEGLRSIKIDSSNLRQVDFFGCIELEKIKIDYCDQLKEMTFPERSSLDTISLDHCGKLVELNINEVQKIKNFSLANLNLILDFKKVDIKEIDRISLINMKLNELDFSQLSIDSISLSGCEEEFTIKKIVFPDNGSLTHFGSSSTSIDEIEYNEESIKNITHLNVQKDPYTNQKSYSEILLNLALAATKVSRGLISLRIDMQESANEIDLSKLDKLAELTLSNFKKIQKLVMPANTDLVFQFSNGEVDEVIIPESANFSGLECDIDLLRMMISKFSPRQCSQVRNLAVFGMRFLLDLDNNYEFDISVFPHAESLTVNSNLIGSLKSSNNSNLAEVNIAGIGALCLVDLRGADKLKSLTLLRPADVQLSQQACLEELIIEEDEHITIQGLNASKLEYLKLASASKDILESAKSKSLRVVKIKGISDGMDLNEYFPNVVSFEASAESNIDINYCRQLKHYTFNVDYEMLTNAKKKVISPIECGYAEVLHVYGDGYYIDPFPISAARVNNVQLVLASFVPEVDWVDHENFPSLKSFSSETSLNNEKKTTKRFRDRRCRIEFPPPDADDNEIINDNTSEQKRMVSVYHKGSLGVDNDTGNDGVVFDSAGDLSVRLYSPNDPQIDHLRMNFVDRYVYENGKLALQAVDLEEEQHFSVDDLSAEFDMDVIQDLIDEAEDNEDETIVMGRLKGKAEPDEWYLLPLEAPGVITDRSQVFLSAGEYAVGYDLAWFPRLKLLGVKFENPEEEDVDLLDIDVFYYMNQDLSYREKTINQIDFPLKTTDNKLPKELHRALYRLVSSHEVLSIILDKKIPLLDRVRVVFNYCLDYKNEKLTNIPEKKSIQGLLNLIHEGKGACRHRSISALALLQLIGVDVLAMPNELHAFCELLGLNDNGEISHLNMDMGGAPAEDLTDESKLMPELPEREKSSPSMASVPSVKNDILDIFKAKFAELADQSEITDLSQLFRKPAQFRARSIRMESESQALDIDAMISNFVKINNITIHYLYIHDREELKQFFNSYRIENGRRTQHQADGVLIRTISQPSLIVVNLSAFKSPEDIDSLKSCIELWDPKLFNYPVNENVVFNFLVTDETPTSEAVDSRAPKVSLSPKLFQVDSVVLIDQMNIDEHYQLDFFNRMQWHEIFYGELKYKDSKLEVFPSPLIKAMKEGAVIHLYNLPDSEELKIQLHRLKTKGEIFFLGEFIKAAPGFSFEVLTRPHQNKLPNVNFIPNDPLLGTKKIFLSLQNINSLYSQLETNSFTGLVNDVEGALSVSNGVFHVIDQIPISEWEFLMNYIERKYPYQPFSFSFAKGAGIEGLSIGVAREVNLVAENYSFFVSNDSAYFMKQLKAQTVNSLPIPVATLTPFGKLVYSVDIEVGDEVHLIEKKMTVLKALEQGISVILYGNMSKEFYDQLLPYFDRFPGKIKLVLEENHSLNLEAFTVHHYNLSDYPVALVDQSYAKKIKIFYDLANKELALRHLAPLPQSFYLFNRMIDKLKKPILHKNNPIKGLILYHYPINSDIYALLNIIAKYIFTSNLKTEIDKERFTAFVNQLTENDELDLNRFYYRVLNRFHGQLLKYIIGDDISLLLDQENRDDGVSERFLYYFKQCYINHYTGPAYQANTASNMTDLEKLLDDESTSFIIPKGPPGTGKTHGLRTLEKSSMGKYKVFEGEKAFPAMMTRNNQGRNILLWDEANMSPPGTFDYAKNFFENELTEFEGSLYPRPDAGKPGKFVAAINPEDLPGRYVHSLFQHYGETLYFKRPSKTFLQRHIIWEMLVGKYPNTFNAMSYLSAAYELFIKHQPLRTVSIRDLENLVSRYLTLAGDISDPVLLDELSYNACLAEFAYSIADLKIRKEYIQALNLELKKESHQEEEVLLHQYVANYYLPTGKFKLAQIIEQDILMREANIPKCKFAILLEGDSGVGKTTMFLKILHKLGYSHQSSGSSKYYYHLSARDLNVEDMLEKAFHEGVIVVLDELNLNPRLERLLNHFLTGVDREGRPAANRGFMVLASQNCPVKLIGRSSNSPALVNRCHVLYSDTFTDKELILFAARVLNNPEEFVEAFRFWQQKRPGIINMRSFYAVLNEIELSQRMKGGKMHDRDEVEKVTLPKAKLLRFFEGRDISTNKPDEMDADDTPEPPH